MSEDQVAELLEQGIAAAKAGRKEEARQALMQVVELDEHREQAWLWLSGVVESADERRICLENVLSINPDNAHAQAGLRWLEQQPPEPAAEPTPEEDRCPRCEAAIPASATECPNCGLPLIVACPACGQYVEVDQSECPSCGHVLGDFREGAVYYLALAQDYIDHRRLDRTQEALARAAAEAPDDPQLLTSMASLYERTGRPDLAAATYERAIEQSPDDAVLYAHLGALYRHGAQMEKARAMYQQAVQLSGSDPALLTELARVQITEGDTPQDVLDLLQRALKLDPDYAPAHLLLGDVYAGQQERNQAYRHYRKVSRLTPADSEIGLEARRKATGLEHSVQQVQRLADGSGERARVQPRQRPGCLSVYAVLLGLSGVLGLGIILFLGVVFGLSGGTIKEALSMAPGVPLPFARAQMGLFIIGSLALSLLMSILYLALAVGLWRLKNWARITVIVLNSLGLLGALVQAASTILAVRQAVAVTGAQAFPLPIMCGLLFGLVVTGYIIFWFVANGELFD